MSKPYLIALAFGAAFFGCVSASATKKPPKEPNGARVADGAQIAIYVLAKESRPFAQTGFQLNIFEASIVVKQTQKHGRQIIRSRLEAIDADLLDPGMWQVGDFNGDGLDDFRAVAQITKKGCRVWNTETWLPDRERFTFAEKIKYHSDADGNPVKSCR